MCADVMSEPSWLAVGSATPTITTLTSTNSFEPLPMSTVPGCPNFKAILIGDAGVGKTTLFNVLRHPNDASRGMDGSMTSASTIGVDTCSRTFTTRYGTITLTLWDTAGVERFRTLTRNYYRNTHAALLVCSIDDSSSLLNLSRWQRDVIESAPAAAHFLVGNKKDLLDQQVVTEESMRNFASFQNCQAAFLTSAKTGEGVESALLAVSEHLVEKYRRHSDMTMRDKKWLDGSGLHVHNAQNSKSGGCCS